jgi:hypothetical protein
MPRSSPRHLARLACCLVLLLGGVSAPSHAASPLPPLIVVARARLATPDAFFPAERGPAGHLTAGMARFAPGSQLLRRDPEGAVAVLIDTAAPAGDRRNPLGLADLQSPDVSFDARRIVFAGTTGPRAANAWRVSWRLYEYDLERGALRQLTFDDRSIAIPEGPANLAAYAGYDDLFPAYLADGRIVFSSSRYPARSPYDGRPAFNLYLLAPDGSAPRRITSERSAALHATPLPDGRILFSRWWVNFNQPGERDIYNRIDNGPGSEIARDASGAPITVRRRVTVRETVMVTATPAPATPTARPTIWPTARPPELRLTPLPTATRPPPAPTPPPLVRERSTVVSEPLRGRRLADGTFIFANEDATFRPARGLLGDGSPIREAPNTWHLMAIAADGTGLARFAWTPRFPSALTRDDGNDTFNAAEPALVFDGARMLVAYTTQRDGTMAHTTRGTGVRVALPGIAYAAANTTESIAGHRWDAAGALDPPYALAPAGLPDGRLVVSHTAAQRLAERDATWRVADAGRSRALPLQAGPWRYELRVMRPDGSDVTTVPVAGVSDAFDLMDATPLVPRPVGGDTGQWQTPSPDAYPLADDDPAGWNVPRGLRDDAGQPAYPWAQRTIGAIALTTLENVNVYANPPLELPYINDSPPLGSVAFADIYIDANQFGGATPRAARPDDQVRAVRWLTVPVDAQGRFIAAAPADTPLFIVLRDRDGRIVRGGARGSLAIAQGNTPGRAGEHMRCVGCHLGHASGSVSPHGPGAYGWTNVAGLADVSASGALQRSGDRPVTTLTDRRGVVPGPSGAFYDTSAPWRGAAGDVLELRWPQPIAVREVRLSGAEPGMFDLADDLRVRAALSAALGGVTLADAGRDIGVIAPLSAGGTRLRFDPPLVLDRLRLALEPLAGTTVALDEVEVIGQGASIAALTSQPTELMLPLVVR